MAKLIEPLAPNVPIVDPKTGFPTPYFARILRDISDARVSESIIAALGGDPGADRMVVWDESIDDLAFESIKSSLDQVSSTHGAVLYRDSTEWLALGPGTAGDVLTTQGSGADPSWTTPTSGGAVEFIGRTALSAVANIDISLPSGYDSFDIEFYFDPSTDNISYSATVTADNFANMLTGATDYSYIQHRASNGSAGVSNSNGAASMQLLVAGQGNDANEYNAGVLRIVNTKETAPSEVIGHFKYVTTAGNIGINSFLGSYKPNTVLDGIRITPSAGTVTGFYKVWGRTA